MDADQKRALGGAALTIAALGVVFGDIGTSPLYTMQICMAETSDVTHAGVMGILSLIVWALIIVVTLKYVVVVMRADNRGEGGTFALWGLLKGYSGKIVGIGLIGYLVVAAAGLLAADGVITPPISMLAPIPVPTAMKNTSW